MPRGRKLSAEQVQAAAVDRRNGLSWKKLSEKYKCAVNTIRFSLIEYSDEFNPKDPPQRSELVLQLVSTQAKLDKIERALKKRFNLHI